MPLHRICLLFLSCLAPLACGSADDADSLGSVAQGLDNPPTSEPDRCTVSRDSTGENLGEGTIDQNGLCCVPQSDGSKTCYGCGDGFTCSSIPSSGKGPRTPPIVVPPRPPIVKK